MLGQLCSMFVCIAYVVCMSESQEAGFFSFLSFFGFVTSGEIKNKTKIKFLNIIKKGVNII